MRRLFFAAFLLIFLGCDDFEPRPEPIAARIVSIEPPDFVLPSDPTLQIQCSHPVPEILVKPERFALAQAKDVNEAFIKDLKDGKVSKKHLAITVPVEVTQLADRRILQIKATRLQNGVIYQLFLAKGACGFEQTTYRFQVNKAQPSLVNQDILTVGSPLVSPNRKWFRLEFSEPLNIDELATQLPEWVDFVEQDGALVKIKANLAPKNRYSIALGGHIIEFETAAESSQLQGLAALQPMVVAEENAARISFAEPGLKEARLWVLGREGVYKSHHFMGAHDIKVQSLTLNQSYSYRLVAQDDFGRIVGAQGTFQTSAMPELAINEILANPNLPKGTPETEAEFVELYNYGGEEIDLGGYMLSVIDQENTRNCLLDAIGVKIPAGEFLLLTGSRFSLSEATTLKAKTTQLCGQLSNSRAQTIQLKDRLGRLVSSFSGHMIANKKGYSIERLLPQGADDKQNFCYSRKDSGPTPGQKNGVSVKGCD